MQTKGKKDPSNIDFLTGLYNRRYLKTRLEEDLVNFGEKGKPYSLLMLDLDHFKMINDTFGHLVGDRVLLRTTGLIKANIRSADVAVRYAGDEFIVLLPGKDQRTALEVAKRFLEASEQTRVILEDGRTVEFAFSVGVATFPNDGKRAEDLLKAVDDALYIAKESGRGKLQAFQRETPAHKREIKYNVLVGREKELVVLKELVKASAQGRGRFLLISGEAGIGKTRLASELLRMASLSSFIVLSTKGDEFVSSNPAKVFLQSLVDLLDTKFRQELMALAEPYSSLLIQGEEKGFSYAEQQVRLAEGIKHIYRELSRRIPVFLFIDDLQWVDESSMGLLLQMSRLAQENRMLLCATYRSEEMGECHHLERFVSNLQREGGFAEIALTDLGLYEVVLLLTTVTRNPNESKKLSELLYNKIGGNPFYIEELLRDLVESERLVWKEDRFCLTDFGEVKLPKSVNSLLKRRLSRLDGDSLRVLQASSVLGNDFKLTVLSGMLDKTEGELLWQLQKGQEAGLIDELTGGEEGWFCFHHPSIRELFYSGLGKKLTSHLHHSVAVTLEAMNGDNLDAQMRHAEEIAHHYLIAEREAQALPYLLMEAERLKKIFSFQQAIEVLQKAIEIDFHLRQVKRKEGLSPRKLAWAYAELGEIETIFGEYESGETHLNQALSILAEQEPSPQEFDTRVLLIRLLLYSGQLEKIPEIATINYQLAERLGDKGRLARSLFMVGRARYMPLKQYALAISYFTQALGVLEKERSPQLWEILSAINRELGNAHTFSGDLPSAVNYYLRSIYWAIRSGEPDLSACAYNDIVLYYDKMGEMEKALKASLKAVNYAEVRKDVWLYSGICHQTSDMAMNLGRLDVAEGCYLNAWEASEKCPGDRRLASITYGIARFYWTRYELEEALAWLDRMDSIPVVDKDVSFYYGKALRARIMLETGDIESAGSLYTECRTDETDHPLDITYVEIECGLAKIDLLRGKAETALQRLLELKNKMEEKREEYLPVWLALAEAYRSLGREQEANRYLDSAMKKLLSILSKIRLDLNRRSFLCHRRDIRPIWEEYRVVHGHLPTELETSLAS